MNRVDTASARHHTYLLASRLFLGGLNDALMPYVEQIPELAAVCPHPFDPEKEAVDYHQIFSFDIFPYESIFRDPSGLLGGAYRSLVQERYERSAFQQIIDADHIGYELAFLAYLCSVEATMLESNQVVEASHVTQEQYGFLQDHLLCWLPPFVNALALSGKPFYATLGQLTLQLAYDHLLQIDTADNKWINQVNFHSDFTLPDAPDILQENQTSLKQVSRFLITPPYSGLYLSHSSIVKLARNHQLPRGFGDRHQLLTNLLRAAGQYEVVPALLEQLIAITITWNHAYQKQIENFLGIENWIRPWQKRAAETSSYLSQMVNMVSMAV